MTVKIERLNQKKSLSGFGEWILFDQKALSILLHIQHWFWLVFCAILGPGSLFLAVKNDKYVEVLWIIGIIFSLFFVLQIRRTITFYKTGGLVDHLNVKFFYDSVFGKKGDKKW